MDKATAKRSYAERGWGKTLFRMPVLITCLKVFFPTALIFGLLSFFVYSIQADKFSEQLGIKEKNIVQLQHSFFRDALFEHIKNALFLAELIQIKSQHIQPSANREPLVNAFIKMMRINEAYDQIRWIDSWGMELIRINRSEGGPIIVPPDQLQNKFGRYYVREGLAGPRIYISKFDLNVELGVIEQPAKPILRITAAVQDELGGNDGLVVLNIRGRLIIDRLKGIGENMTGSLGLLNPDGYWLISSNPSEEWAFMYPDKLGHTFQAAHPDLWPGIKDKSSGQFSTLDGLITFATVNMDSPFVSVSGYLVRAAESWKLVSLIRSDRLIPAWRGPYITGVLAIFFLMAGTCFYWASASVNRAEARKLIFESEEKFRMVTGTMADAVIMMDARGRIRFWSDSARRMLGYSAKEAMGRFLHEIVVTGHSRERAKKEFGTALSFSPDAQAALPSEIIVRRKDGVHLPVGISVMPLEQDGKHLTVGIIRDLSEQKMAEAEKSNLLVLSTTDGLTGLANRRYFDEALGKEYRRHSRSGGLLSLIFMDVDYFKAFNDTYGHIEGDHCLQQVARIFAECAHRRSDIAARYGGEEFACILPETGSIGAVAMAEKIRKKVEALAIPHGKSAAAPHVTISIGVATAFCFPDDSPEVILSHVDEQLYKAKTSGRNRVASIDLSGSGHADRGIVQLMWKASFCCGDELMDSQHKALFGCCNQMFTAMTSNRPIREISDLFADLLEKLRRHFKDEEQVMQTIGYTEMVAHAKEHARLLAKAMTLSNSLDDSIPRVGETLNFFIEEIVVLHMIGMDRKYYPLIPKNRLN